VYLQDRSIAASLTGLQYRNCVLICEESSIDGEMQFFQQNNYFSRVGLITCLTLINNLEVKRIVRGQKAGSLSNSGDFVHLVRSGELQICKETEEWTGVRSTLELISFPAGEFFGFYQFRESTSCEYIIKCKSAYCTLFAFDRKFFESYIQVICGDKLKAYQSNLTKYLEKHEDEAGQMRKINMKFLTQTNFNQRKSTQ
jgi:CRP-like cAMP-binding protein